MTDDDLDDEFDLPASLYLDFVEAEELPVAAMAEATANWDACADFFVGTLQDYASGEFDLTEDGDGPLILLHLLGQQRERRAFLPLIALLRQDIETLEAALGDALTETLPQILVGVFDGDPTALENLIADRTVDETCRWCAIDAYMGLVLRGTIDKARALGLLNRIAELGLAPEDTAWCGWVRACALTGDATLLDRARAMIADGRVAPIGMWAGDAERDIAAWSAGHARALEETAPIEDAAALLSTWHGYTEAGIAERRKASGLGLSVGPETYVNPYRDVGRNDPCPCGSGKKFKRCHGAPA